MAPVISATTQALPQELLDRICEFCDFADLKRLRLVSKRLDASAAKSLFNHVRVLPTESSVGKCLALMSNTSRRRHVHSIIFETFLDPCCDYDSDLFVGMIQTDSGKQHLPQFYTALSSLASFPQLRRVEVRFSERCNTTEQEEGFFWSVDATEDAHVRAKILQALARNDEFPEGLRSLVLRNLMDVLPDWVTEMEGWKRMMGELDSLALWITSDFDAHEIGRDMLRAALHRFYATDLKPKLLLPVREQLRELKLGGNEIYWGVYPFFDLRGEEMHFPNLRVLVLRRMAFAHDWQIEWMISHSDTLETLVLDDCPIVTAGATMNPMPHAFAIPKDHLLHSSELYFRNPVRWYTHFHLFKTRLPHLTHFAIRTHSVQYPLAWAARSETDSFNNTYELENSLEVSRYRYLLAFEEYMDYARVQIPEWYVEDRREGVLGNFGIGGGDEERFTAEEARWVRESEGFPDCWAEDKRALEELVEAVGKRRRTVERVQDKVC